MTCCAVGTCDDPDCHLCQTVAKLPQPQAPRDGAPTLLRPAAKPKPKTGRAR